MNVREAVFAWMAERGIDRVFGNPGSTEVPFLLGLDDDAYVLGLQESVVVAMADGHARATGRPAFVNLHTAPGLGHAMGAIHTAAQNRTPLVLTAGQQDTRHLARKPLLSGDLVGMVRSEVKRAWEVARPEDVPAALEEAYRLAMAPPSGPVFVSIPSDFWDAEARPPRVTPSPPDAAPQGLEGLVEALSGASRPALVFGPGVDRAGASEAAVALAERLGAPVYASPLADRLAFPTDHGLYQGMLAPAAPRITHALMGHDVVAVFGAPLFLVYPYLPGPILPPGIEAHLVTDDPEEAARAPGQTYVGDVGAALRHLAAAVPDKGVPVPAAAASAKKRSEAVRAKARMGPAFVLHTLGRKMPEGTVLVDESISSSLTLREHIPFQPGGYHTAASGQLGWALPASVGMQMADPGRPVLCVIGDGSCLYGIQALWTAAQRGLSLKIVVLNNGGYAILKSYTESFYPGGKVPGLDLPGLDHVRLAEGFGVTADRVTAPDGLGAAFDAMFAHDGPYLLDVSVDRRVPSLF